MFENSFDGMIPIGLPKDSVEREFLSLLEETQQLLLRKGGDTDEKLRRNLSELSMRE